MIAADVLSLPGLEGRSDNGPLGGGAGDLLTGTAAHVDKGDAPRNGSHVTPAWPFGRMLKELDTSRPNIARAHGSLLGGTDNFAADREEAARLTRICPHPPRFEKENWLNLGRALHLIAFDGQVKRFLDIDSGLPAAAGIHEAACSVAPHTWFAHIDNDRGAVAHASALLADRRT